MSDLLERALDELVPSFAGEEPDWTDVVTRSRPIRRAGSSPVWRRHPRRTVAVALALLLLVLLATPAFGVQGYVLHLLGRKNVSFSSSPPAPNVVKKQFLDLPLGAPAQWSTPVRAAQARVIGTFTIGGHPRKLWVAPTTKGGFCYTLEESFGGCRLTRAQRDVAGRGQFGVTWQGGSPKHGVNVAIVTRVGGDITAPAAARITARYADGSSAEIPFVWVSAPIAAGFYSYDVPTAHWNKPHRLLSLTLYAANGKKLGQQTFPYQRVRPVPLPRLGTPATRVLPTAPPVMPSTPTQSGAADGFQVTVGHNGAVQFTQTGQTPILAELKGKSVGYSCFRLTTEFGIFTVRGLGEGAKLAPKVGFMLNGVGRPVDGCELQSSIGHLWPDRLHNHAAVEIALTAKGRAFFADRAAARDLALFVRTKRVQELRKQPAATAKADILHRYGAQLSNSPIAISVVNPTTLTFTERSSTGKQFTVTVHNGRIANENVKPYAFVF
jgi:hypothetical protein